jgi:hypothetical protein
MKKITLGFLLTLATLSAFAADTIIINKTKFPMSVNYHTCKQIPNVGTKCDLDPIEESTAIPPMDGNGKNFAIISADDMTEIFIDQESIQTEKNLVTYNLKCGDMIGGAIILDDMGGMPALVCSYSSSYEMHK